MTDIEIWNQLDDDFGSDGGAQRESIKDAAVRSFSHDVAESNTIQASGARGNGHQAMMHGADVWTWPATLAEVAPQFLSTVLVDTATLCNDRAGRGTGWANAATTSARCFTRSVMRWASLHDRESFRVRQAAQRTLTKPSKCQQDGIEFHNLRMIHDLEMEWPPAWRDAAARTAGDAPFDKSARTIVCPFFSSAATLVGVWIR